MTYKVTISKMISEKKWQAADKFEYSSFTNAWGEFYEQVAKSQHKSEPVSIKLTDENEQLAIFTIK
jgi:hypothetical protein